MASKFQHKRSTTAGVIPTTGQVSNGEIAINLADGVIYTNNGSAVIVVGHTLAGSNTQVQFNDSGFANASAGMVFSKASNTLTIGNTVSSAHLRATGIGSNAVAILTGNAAFGWLLSFKKSDNTDLFYNQFDGSNFHHYMYSTLYMNLRGNGYIFNGNTSSYVMITGGAYFRTDPPNDGTTPALTVGDGSYANTTNPMSNSTFAQIKTWGSNSTSGAAFVSVSKLKQVQLSNTDYDAYFSIANNTTDIFKVFLSNGNITIANSLTATTTLAVGANTVANTTAILANNLFLTANSCDSATTVTTTGTSAQNIDTFSLSSYRSGKYFYSAKDNNANAYQTGEFVVIYDGTTATLTEYSTISTNASFTFALTATSNSTAVIIQATPSSTNTTVQVRRTLLWV